MQTMPVVEGLREFYDAKMCGGPPRPEMHDKLLLDTLSLGNQQMFQKLNFDRPDFELFQYWIVETAGLPDPALLDRYHSWLAGRTPGPAAQEQLSAIAALPPVLDEAALAHWEKHGYVVFHDAITPDEIAAVCTLLWEAIGASPDNPASWPTASTDGIMVTRFQHPALEAARRSPRIWKAFAQLWGETDLWVTIDRMGFNPPEATSGFRGSGLHWDASLVQPVPFGTQAVLYLTDTAEDQGAFQCVPGFHHRIDAWLSEQRDIPPRHVDLSAEAVHVPGRAGDLIIWRQDLPHAASPNRTDRPRLVQYLNYYSPDMVIQPEWR